MRQTLLFPDCEELPGFEFPLSLTERYRPQLIGEFAGLVEVRRELTAWARTPRDCGFLFVGPAGTGKTSMARSLALECKGFVSHIAAGECTVDVIRATAYRCHYLPPMGYLRHVVVIDEMDLASKAAQNAMLSYLDGTNGVPMTTWVMTCNGTERLEDRFVSRCRVMGFSTYGIQADAAGLLERVWESESKRRGIGAGKPNMARLIKEQNGNVRAALQVLESKLDSI